MQKNDDDDKTQSKYKMQQTQLELVIRIFKNEIIWTEVAEVRL